MDEKSIMKEFNKRIAGIDNAVIEVYKLLKHKSVKEYLKRYESDKKNIDYDILILKEYYYKYLCDDDTVLNYINK